jgi:hypothetical protein
MRWEDEPYVKVYQRDTPEWCLLSWEARGVFVLLLRAVDRAGVLRLGPAGSKSIAALLRVPLKVIDRVLPELAADGCIELRPGDLVIPNFIEAQESRQSDKARQKASRERARLGLSHVTKRDEPVTKRDDPSRDVTEPSHAVTRGHTASLLDQTRSDQRSPSAPLAGGDTATAARVGDPEEATTAPRKPRGGARKRPNVEMPQNWAPSADHREKGRKLGLDVARVDAEAERFRDHHRARGAVFADWDAAFRNWLGNVPKFNASGPGPGAVEVLQPYVARPAQRPRGIFEEAS